MKVNQEDQVLLLHEHELKVQGQQLSRPFYRAHIAPTSESIRKHEDCSRRSRIQFLSTELSLKKDGLGDPTLQLETLKRAPMSCFARKIFQIHRVALLARSFRRKTSIMKNQAIK